MSRCTFLNGELFPSLFFNLDLRRLNPTDAAEIEAEYRASEQASESASLAATTATTTESIAIGPDSPLHAATISDGDTDSFGGSTVTLCPGRPASPVVSTTSSAVVSAPERPKSLTFSIVSPVAELAPKRRRSVAKAETFSSGKSTVSVQADRADLPPASASSSGDTVSSRHSLTGPSVNAPLAKSSSLKKFMTKFLPDYSPGASRPLSLVVPKQVASSEVVHSHLTYSWANIIQAVPFQFSFACHSQACPNRRQLTLLVQSPLSATLRARGD